MDYEKKYKKALERAATELETCGADESLRNMIYAIFPDELKESEDEQTRKGLINFLKSPFIRENICDWKVAPWIAWLEKQEPTQSEVTKTSEQVPSLLDLKLMDCPLSVRTLNALRLWDKPTKDITLKDLVGCTKKELLGARNFGNTMLIEVEDFLTGYGLKLKGE